MALTIKTPAGDVVGAKSPSKGTRSDATYNGEPGSEYQKRTPSPNAVPEKTYEGDYPKSGLDIKTPTIPTNPRK